jgi:hypothetical protein
MTSKQPFVRTIFRPAARPDLARQRDVLREELALHGGEGDRLNPEDLDLEAGGGVREAHGLGPREAVRPRAGDRGQHDVARAGHVVHLARDGRDVQRRLTALLEQGAVLVERDDHRVEIELAAQRRREAGGVRRACLERRRHARRPLRFGAIRRDRRRAAVLRVVADRGGIDEDRPTERAASGDEPAAEVGRADALVVVLEADDVDRGQQRLDALEQGVRDRGADRLARLDVHAEHLLRMAVLGEADEAALDRRRALAIDEDPVHRAAAVAQGADEHAPLRVVADDAEARDLAPERGEASRDVRRAARHALRARRVQDRHRRVRAQPLGGAVEVLVEHEVPDHDRGERPVGGKLLEESGHRDLRFTPERHRAPWPLTLLSLPGESDRALHAIPQLRLPRDHLDRHLGHDDRRRPGV